MSSSGRDDADAGVVDEDVQPAEVLHRRAHHHLDLFTLRHVRALRQARAARRLNLLRDCGGVRPVDVGNRHADALARQAQRNRAANAAARPGDDGRLALQPVARLRLARHPRRLRPVLQLDGVLHQLQHEAVRVLEEDHVHHAPAQVKGDRLRHELDAPLLPFAVGAPHVRHAEAEVRMRHVAQLRVGDAARRLHVLL